MEETLNSRVVLKLLKTQNGDPYLRLEIGQAPWTRKVPLFSNIMVGLLRQAPHLAHENKLFLRGEQYLMRSEWAGCRYIGVQNYVAEERQRGGWWLTEVEFHKLLQSELTSQLMTFTLS